MRSWLSGNAVPSVLVPPLLSALLAASPILASPLAAQEIDASRGTESSLGSATPKELLAQRATVQGDQSFAGQLVRLPLDIEVLEHTRPDISDLRLYLGNQQLGYVVRRAPLNSRVLRQTVEAELGPRVTQRTRGGEQRVPNDVDESYTLAPPPHSVRTPNGSAQAGEDWQLRLEVPRAKGAFLAQLRLSWIGDGTEATRPIYDGTVFRLSDGRERLTVALPTSLASDGRLLVELDRQLSASGPAGALEPRFVYQGFEGFNEQAPGIELEVSYRLESRAGVAVYRFELPRGLVPDAFHLETSRGNFDRSLRVFGIAGSSRGTSSARLSGRTLLASGRIYRFRSAERSSEPKLDIGLSNSSSTAFEIEIDGGDSPPLDDLRITALVQQPEVIFEWPSAQGNDLEVEVLFGGGRVAPPNFDLWSRTADVVSSVRGVSVALADQMEVRTLLDGDGLEAVSRGEISPNPDFDQTPLLGFLQRAGAQVDEGLFSFLAPITLEENETGLHLVELGPSVQAQLRSDCGDLRFVDDQGQWPYILESGRSLWQQRLEVGVVQERGQSLFTLRLPEDLTAGGQGTSLNADTLNLLVNAPFFDRAYVLEALNENAQALSTVSGRLAPASAREAFYAPGLSEREVTLAVPPGRAHEYRLTVDDGDDAPLELSTASLSGPSLHALLVAPPGQYRVLYGSAAGSSIPPPTYELARAGNVVRSLRGTPAAVGAPQAIAGWRWSSLPWQQVLLWAAIVIAALGLGWVTFRSIGQENNGSA